MIAFVELLLQWEDHCLEFTKLLKFAQVLPMAEERLCGGTPCLSQQPPDCTLDFCP